MHREDIERSFAHVYDTGRQASRDDSGLFGLDEFSGSLLMRHVRGQRSNYGADDLKSKAELNQGHSRDAGPARSPGRAEPHGVAP